MRRELMKRYEARNLLYSRYALSFKLLEHRCSFHFIVEVETDFHLLFRMKSYSDKKKEILPSMCIRL